MRTYQLLLVASIPLALAACLLPEPADMGPRTDGGFQVVAVDAGTTADAQTGTTVDGGSADATILPCTGGTTNATDPATGHCYMFMNSQLDWLDSRIACTALGARTHLATITSASEQALLTPLITANDTWIGLDDNQTEGTFVWTTGELLGYTHWATGEPNNGGGATLENCAVMRGTVGEWDDRDCSLAYNYLCERE